MLMYNVRLIVDCCVAGCSERSTVEGESESACIRDWWIIARPNDSFDTQKSTLTPERYKEEGKSEDQHSHLPPLS
jgi:hypothetical protein